MFRGPIRNTCGRFIGLRSDFGVAIGLGLDLEPVWMCEEKSSDDDCICWWNIILLRLKIWEDNEANQMSLQESSDKKDGEDEEEESKDDDAKEDEEEEEEEEEEEMVDPKEKFEEGKLVCTITHLCQFEGETHPYGRQFGMNGRAGFKRHISRLWSDCFQLIHIAAAARHGVAQQLSFFGFNSCKFCQEAPAFSRSDNCRAIH